MMTNSTIDRKSNLSSMLVELSPSQTTTRPTSVQLKSSLATKSKRRTEKRVRFALDLNTIISPSRENSALNKSHQRVVDPWQQVGPLNDAYAEYLRKASPSNLSKTEILRVSPCETLINRQSPIYTHTFVVPPEPKVTAHQFPQIVQQQQQQQSTKMPRRPLPTIDSYLKQQLTISTPPRILPVRKTNTPAESHRPYLSVHTLLKQLETPPSSSSSDSSGRNVRADAFFHSKPTTESIQRAKINQLMSKSLSNGFHQMNSLIGERSVLPNYHRKVRQPISTSRIIDGFYVNPYAVSITNPYRSSFLPTILDPTR